MPHLLKAVIRFPKWGLNVSPRLETIIASELFSPGASFDVPLEDEELCTIKEQACFARFTTLELEMKQHAIPYDIIFNLPNKESTTQRSWRPGSEGEIEFQRQDEPAVLTDTLKDLTATFPDAVPSILIETLCYEAQYRVSSLSLWDDPGVHPTLNTPANYMNEMVALVTVTDDNPDLSAIVSDYKRDEADTINKQGTEHQLRYLMNKIGVNETKTLLNDLVMSPAASSSPDADR